jgi:hypothetical protein
VFAWKPQAGDSRFTLLVARDEEFANVVIALDDLADPVYLPTDIFAVGTYYWKWQGQGEPSVVQTFEIKDDAVHLPVSNAVEWLAVMPASHPRLYLKPDAIEELRLSRFGARSDKWETLAREAEGLLSEPHEIEEPPYLADREIEYNEWYRVWYDVLIDSRRFMAGARTLALAYQASGDRRYGDAAAQRLVSISRWDPMGSSHIDHNDEAHMSVIWNGPVVADWAWDCFTDAQRAIVIDQFRKRGAITFEHMHDRGAYGVTRFDSHAGREIVFLALIAMAFHEHIPDACGWLDRLRPVLCGIWPVWSGDDGAWAEGPNYGLNYVTIMTLFASALKSGVGIDLYRRPFWRNHARWRCDCQPHYAEWMGFGDQSEVWEYVWNDTASLVELIGRETETSEFDDYVAGLRAYASRYPTPPERREPTIDPIAYISQPTTPQPVSRERMKLLSIYPQGGWAALRTNPMDPSRDVALLFRSSPYGSFSHAHANQNDFILHVAGHCVVMPSGYYDGYESPHHSDWVWHTKSHNCVTLSDSSQIMRSYEAVGRIENAYEDDRIAYFLGNADPAYANNATYCRRHVLYLKGHRSFILVDEFRAVPGQVATLQWNLHSWDQFEISEIERRFHVGTDGARLHGQFLSHLNSYFTVTKGWNPKPASRAPEWPVQHNLTYTVAGPAARRILAVVLTPECFGCKPLSVRPFRAGKTEGAALYDDMVLIDQGAGIDYGDYSSSHTAAIRIDGSWYEIGDCGVRPG